MFVLNCDSAGFNLRKRRKAYVSAKLVRRSDNTECLHLYDLQVGAKKGAVAKVRIIIFISVYVFCFEHHFYFLIYVVSSIISLLCLFSV